MDDDDDEKTAGDKKNCQDFEWFDKYVLKSILGEKHPFRVRRDANPSLACLGMQIPLDLNYIVDFDWVNVYSGEASLEKSSSPKCGVVV